MENLGTFMNLMTDFAFKRLFGTVERKGILIRFLEGTHCGGDAAGVSSQL